MVIDNKAKLRFCLMADSMMNRGYFKLGLKARIKKFLLGGDPIMDYLRAMRYSAYYANVKLSVWGG